MHAGFLLRQGYGGQAIRITASLPSQEDGLTSCPSLGKPWRALRLCEIKSSNPWKNALGDRVPPLCFSEASSVAARRIGLQAGGEKKAPQ